jgi:hypothetical protein
MADSTQPERITPYDNHGLQFNLCTSNPASLARGISGNSTELGTKMPEGKRRPPPDSHGDESQHTGASSISQGTVHVRGK